MFKTVPYSQTRPQGPGSRPLCRALRRFAPVFLLLTALHSRAEPRTALQVVKACNDEILALHAAAGEAGAAELENKVGVILNRVASFATMAERVAVPFVDRLDAGQRARFVNVFADLLRLSATQALGRRHGDRFDYVGEEQADDGVWVRTVAHRGQEALAIDFQLERIGDEYRIVNYVVDDIDTVLNYRKQIGRMLKEKPADDVIGRLEARVKELSAP